MSGPPDKQTIRAAVHDVWGPGKDAERAMHKFREAGLSSSDLLNKRFDDVNDKIRQNANVALRRTLGKDSLNALRGAIRVRRLDARPAREASVIFTAPHTLLLHRDNGIPHVCEDYTGTLARRFAEIVRGGFVTWAEHERARVKVLPEPDRTNRDPNYLTNEELLESPWFHALHSGRRNGQGRRWLHIDLHGMRGPNDSNPVKERPDCIMGTAAMERRYGPEVAQRFRDNLSAMVEPILADADFEMWHNIELTGDWGAERNTLTQMSTDPALWHGGAGMEPFHRAVQVEMSYKLRKYLHASETARKSFVCALLEAFEMSA